MKQLEPVLLLLAAMVIFFTGLLIWSSTHLANDGQTFQVLSGLVTGFAGAFLMRVKPRADRPQEPETPPEEGEKAKATGA